MVRTNIILCSIVIIILTWHDVTWRDVTWRDMTLFRYLWIHSTCLCSESTRSSVDHQMFPIPVDGPTFPSFFRVTAETWGRCSMAHLIVCRSSLHRADHRYGTWSYSWNASPLPFLLESAAFAVPPGLPSRAVSRRSRCTWRIDSLSSGRTSCGLSTSTLLRGCGIEHISVLEGRPAHLHRCWHLSCRSWRRLAGTSDGLDWLVKSCSRMLNWTSVYPVYGRHKQNNNSVIQQDKQINK